MTDQRVERVSIWAPLKRRAFLWLWLGMIVASLGAWAQTVGAQWLFVNDPNAATIVTLVQTASTLPMMLLALPAGVLADSFDRRWLMIGVQIYFVTVAILLTVLTAIGMMPPALMLTFTFAVGVGTAMLSPTWQAMITELVPRTHIQAATRLDMISVNVARAAGPAIAGALIAAWGVPVVFALNAVCGVFLAAVLIAWRRPRVRRSDPERFFPALLAGGRYVRHDPMVRRLLVRLSSFVGPAAAVWALLPLIARRQLGLGAGGYGVLFAALGLGALVGALIIGRVRERFTANQSLILAALAFAASLGALAFAHTLWVALIPLMVCGLGWTATVSVVVSELQLLVPGWVRARAIAVYLMAFLGTLALASPVWGLATQWIGLTEAVLAAAALVAASAAGSYFFPFPERVYPDRSPVAYWSEPAFESEPDPQAGPVLVTLEIEIDPKDEAEFLVAMDALRLSRLRSGATRWELYRVGEAPDRFMELFQVPTWEVHRRQHDGRLTADDQAIEDAAFAFAVRDPRALHLLPPDASVTD
ncbi:MAG TPA: MFS transporter [Propionicimonas sp.]|nr:MFS transporter [Propionicimonas sp.]